jgi:hypothetical protein
METKGSDSDQSPVVNYGISGTEISDFKPRNLILLYKFFFVLVRKLKHDCY